MAKLVWVYTLSVAGVTGLTDQNGIVVGNPKVGMIYAALDDNTDIADDGSGKLYHSATGIIDPIGLAEAIKAFNGVVTPVPPSGFSIPTEENVTDVGFKVNWTAPSGGDAVTNYEVAVTDGGVAIASSPFTMAGGTLSKTVSGLTASTDYEVTVTAINGAGQIAASAITVSTTA